MTLAIGLVITVIGLTVAGRRLWWLVTLIRSGQPASGRFDGLSRRLRTELKEVAGQSRLLRWSVPGIAHFFTMWGFIVLSLTIVELYGTLADENFAIPFFGREAWLGFVEDFFAVAVIAALAVFAVLRVRHAPVRRNRESRFYGSHTAVAWTILGMIALVVGLLLVWRAAQINTGRFPYGETWWAFGSMALARLLRPLGEQANAWIENVLLIAQITTLMIFLVVVAHSKHLHIGAAPVNVLAKREPVALGPLLPMESGGAPIDLDNPDDDAVVGRGTIEDFTWKGMLDFATCTECGRCQSQCPAWTTGKPLSPKLLIMDLRDHLFAKTPTFLDTFDRTSNGLATLPTEPFVPVEAPSPNGHHAVPASGFRLVPAPGPGRTARPLVGTPAENGVIDPRVLWSCTTCGACVEQCPVDIEHLDHIVDMRRHQVLRESAFPGELGGLFTNLETSGNPWGARARTRLDWARGLDFEIPVVGSGVADLTEVDYLFWVGCAGATDDRAKRTTRAVAELLHRAGVTFAVLGEKETCTGDAARRAGNESLFQLLASRNVVTLDGAAATRIVVTCPHCLNTLKNEYPQVGGHYDVVHHTQLLNRLVREGRLTPLAPPSGGGRIVTYHDPCYLGRHNDVYEPPRDLIESLPGLALTEMPRASSGSFCCGAGGARLWMEEDLGQRVNDVRAAEAVATGAEQIGVACPFCLMMLGDGVAGATAPAPGREIEVVDVAQMLLRAVRDGDNDAGPAAQTPAAT
ncbi:MAG: hypothetical protein QG622_1222 [Actinomycetota bacterium]|nr:hypothetical protein [Actinomycetota bacterium]